ncbi:hypothetical protein WICPIJ_001550 [Wickerhamomyces pijperi]|uniref:Uncharacterized protein n=1 Tax=Wickerhamomyces pijperi TaxID=599730 RepID=A0A9P8TQL4_WICPI|nr:hypothetical protein WICPIJ_001550 [Wickerhamomyces pijperi]
MLSREEFIQRVDELVRIDGLLGEFGKVELDVWVELNQPTQLGLQMVNEVSTLLVRNRGESVVWIDFALLEVLDQSRFRLGVNGGSRPDLSGGDVPRGDGDEVGWDWHCLFEMVDISGRLLVNYWQPGENHWMHRVNLSSEGGFDRWGVKTRQ